jgi:K+-sensing histidine kinase KdpD
MMYQYHSTVAAATAVFLVVVMVESLTGDFTASSVASIIAFAYLDYFFTEPKWSFVVACWTMPEVFRSRLHYHRQYR